MEKNKGADNGWGTVDQYRQTFNIYKVPFKRQELYEWPVPSKSQPSVSIRGD